MQGYGIFGGHLFPIPGSNRALGLNPAATPEFVNTPGQVAFSPDGSQLIVTTKANGSDIDVFRVHATERSPAPVVNSEPGTVPFAVTFDGAGNLVVTEAGTNAVATFDLHDDGTITPLSGRAHRPGRDLLDRGRGRRVLRLERRERFAEPFRVRSSRRSHVPRQHEYRRRHPSTPRQLRRPLPVRPDRRQRHRRRISDQWRRLARPIGSVTVAERDRRRRHRRDLTADRAIVRPRHEGAAALAFRLSRQYLSSAARFWARVISCRFGWGWVLVVWVRLVPWGLPSGSWK